MALVDYELDKHVAVISMNSGENRFNAMFLDKFLSVLDDIENNTKATVIVVRSSHEKIWGNGLDLDWLVPVVQAEDKGPAIKFFFQLNELFLRIATCPMLTIAAITGHAFAGGAIFSGAFDFRFMRTDRGFWCVPEIDLGIPFLPGMVALLRNVMPNNVLHEMALTGHRLTAGQCLEAKMVHGAFHIDELMDKVMEFAEAHNKRREVVGAIKKEVHRDIIHAIEVLDPPVINTGRFNI